jgi:cell division protein FtsB
MNAAVPETFSSVVHRLFSVPYRSLEPVSKQLTIIVGLTVVGFMTFGLALSFYRNVLFDETLKNIGEQNDKLQAGINTNQGDLDYYRSAQYKDKYAKENLGKINPGEKILIITQDPRSPNLNADTGMTPQEEKQAVYEEHLREMPVYLHWQLYLFDREKLDQIKQGL